jgi:tetratricopeptide (TPR) repeat protein
LARARTLIQRKRWNEAIQALEALGTGEPDRPEALRLLLQAYEKQRDLAGYQRTAERLLAIEPHNLDVLLALAASYLAAMRPALALRTYRRFLERWPHHVLAPRIRNQVEEMENGIREWIGDIDVPDHEILELATAHEEVAVLTQGQRFEEARQAAERLLQRWPKFPPALNNLSLGLAHAGQFAEAIAAAQRVLAFAPENFHALSNLVHFLCMSGRVAEAKEYAERLKAVRSEDPESWVKKAEALSYLGDDAGVLAAFQSAQEAGAPNSPEAEAFLLHLAAVATLRQGEELQARRLWEQARDLDPNLPLAQENLRDLRRPVEERHAPWAFPANNWVPAGIFDALVARTKEEAQRDKEASVAPALAEFFQEHPQLKPVIPLLLDRGDPLGREMALGIARFAEDPELNEALRDFALGPRGPDRLRFQAAQTAEEAGLLPHGPVRMWVKGEWREIQFMGYEIHGEADPTLSPEVEQLALQGHEAIRAGKPAEAERLFREALKLDPDTPSLWQNLAAACQHQGRDDEALEIVRQIHERHPDYLFARTAMAVRAALDGKFEEAKALMEPLTQRRRFHYSEFASYAQAQIEISLAERELAAACHWLQMWEQMDPGNPHQERWRSILRPRSPLALLRRPRWPQASRRK